MAVKNSFFAMSNTYATTEGSTASSRGGGTAYAIDPCPKCSTIGRAINGWHQMATFYNGIDGAGVYNPYAVGTSDYYVGDSSEGLFWDSDVRTGLTLAMVAGLIDMDTYNLLVDRQELEQNTYGSAAFTSFYIYETWYGVATTFSVSDAGWQDDLFAFSYYHPAAYAGILKYDTNALISGGFQTHRQAQLPNLMHMVPENMSGFTLNMMLQDRMFRIFQRYTDRVLRIRSPYEMLSLAAQAQRPSQLMYTLGQQTQAWVMPRQ